MSAIWLILNPAHWLFFLVAAALVAGFFYVKRVADFVTDTHAWAGVALGAIVFGWMGMSWGNQITYAQLRVDDLRSDIARLKDANKSLSQERDRNAALVVTLSQTAHTYEDRIENLKKEQDDAAKKHETVELGADCARCVRPVDIARMLRGEKK